MNKRPILIVTVSYIIGILWGLYLEISIVPFVLLIIAVFIAIMLFFKYGANKYFKDVEKVTNYQSKIIFQKFNLISIMLIIVCISSVIVQFKEKNFNRTYDIMPIESCSIIGIVEKEGKDSEYYYNYVVKVKGIIGVNNNSFNRGVNPNNYESNIKESSTNIIKEKLINKRVLLKVKKSKVSQFQNLEYGDEIIVEGSIENASTRRNYKGYDYRQYLKTKGIYGIFKTNTNTVNVVKKNSGFVINMWINKLKNKIKHNLLNMLSNENAKIALALYLGDSDFIGENQKQIFSDASLSHILAISGMHVTYVIIGCSWILKRFDKRKGKYVLVCVLILFAELTGGSASVIRAVIMGAIMIISKLLYRKSDALNNIGIACLILLICNPYNILNLGFQLSFLGTLGIVLFYKKIDNKCNKGERISTNEVNVSRDNSLGNKLKSKALKSLKSILITSISANILIFPILVYVFNTVSLTFLFSNILISPILGGLFFTGYITIIVSLMSTKMAIPFAKVLNFLIHIFNKIAIMLSNIKFTRCVITTPRMITIALYYLLILFVFYYNSSKLKGYTKKKIIAVVSIIMIVSHFLPNYNQGLMVYFIDVGQGDSTLIVTEENKKILIDGGGSETGNYDVGEKVLVPYLLNRGVKKIDYILVSHFDSDHCKGLFSVIEKLDVKNVIICEQGKNSENYQYFQKLAINKKVNIICVKAGNKIKIDKSTCIDILWPESDLISENILNNNSIVGKLNYRNTSILFTGDIEKVAEERIVKKYSKELLNCRILKVAHHGSKTSSTEEFIKMVEPRVALIGVGENNNFGHPNMEVIGRLEEVGADIYRTDMMGEIILKINKNGKMYNFSKKAQ